MLTDLARHQSQMPAAGEWRQMLEMADVFLKSGLLPDTIKTPAAAVTIIQKGRELGLPPLYALSIISVIKGKPVCGAEGMLAMIYRDHGDGAVHFLETSAKECRVAYKRRGGERGEFSFTFADAERAGLTRQDNYTKYAPAMLRARCVSAMARFAFPDTIGGLYTPEEMGARVIVDADGQVVLDDAGAPEEATFLGGEIYLKHMAAITTAKSLNELKDAWSAAKAERALVTPDEWTEINRATNELKTEMDAVVPTTETATVS